MSLQTLSNLFVSIIALWAVWAILSNQVRDGIAGKLIYAAIALSGYAIATRAESIYLTPTVAGVTFHASLALAGLRHFVMVTWWERIKTWLCRYLHCEHCLYRDTRRVKIERRKS